MNIKFSVIIPCYNSEDYIVNALESIFKQTYDNWEIVVINDGSTDSTPTIIQKYMEHDGRIKMFSKENGGYASAINRGLDEVTGDYFLMLGSDDYFGHTLFSDIINQIGDSYPDVIAFKTVRIHKTYEVVDGATKFNTPISMANTTIDEYELKYPNHAMIFSRRDTSKCFKTSLIGNLKYFGKYGIDSDEVFSMMLCRKANSFASVPTNGYFWNVREGSVGSSYNKDKNLDRMYVWINFYSFILQKNTTPPLSTGESTYIPYITSLIDDFISDQKLKAIKYYKIIKTLSKTQLKVVNKYNFDIKKCKIRARSYFTISSIIFYSLGLFFQLLFKKTRLLLGKIKRFIFRKKK